MQVGLNAGVNRYKSTLGGRLFHARKERRKLTQPQLAKLAGMKQSDISKLERGKSLATSAIGRLASALMVSPLWLELGEGPEPDWENTAPLLRGVAHPVSQLSHIVASSPMTWEEVTMRPLPEAFALTLRDDALAPDFPSGSIMRFSTKLAPEAGRPVLVADAEGEHYVRIYQIGRGSDWLAVAVNRHYQSWSAVSAGLAVLAAFTGFDLPPIR